MRQSTLLLLLWSFLVHIPSLSAQCIKVACIGNSVTYGYGLEDPAVQSYPTILGHLLGEEYEVRNFGHSGSTLLTDGHNPYVKTKEYAAALAFKPDVAVIHLGLNDTDPRNFPHYRDRFVADYCALIDSLRAVNPAMDNGHPDLQHDSHLPLSLTIHILHTRLAADPAGTDPTCGRGPTDQTYRSLRGVSPPP